MHQFPQFSSNQICVLSSFHTAPVCRLTFNNRLISLTIFFVFSDWTKKLVMKKFAPKSRKLLMDQWRVFWDTQKTKLSPLTLSAILIHQFSMPKLVSCSQALSSNSFHGKFYLILLKQIRYQKGYCKNSGLSWKR